MARTSLARTRAQRRWVGIKADIPHREIGRQIDIRTSATHSIVPFLALVQDGPGALVVNPGFKMWLKKTFVVDMDEQVIDIEVSSNERKPNAPTSDGASIGV